MIWKHGVLLTHIGTPKIKKLEVFMFEVKNLNDEYFSQLDPGEVLDIKKLSTEDKILCFRYFLSSDAITNVSVISNLFLLINGISDIDDNALEDERIFFSSLEEYVDVKLEIKEEIDKFNIALLEYYLGIVEGLNVTLDELKSHIPNTHFNLMSLVTPELISKLMLKYLTRIDCHNVKPAFNANDLYNKINSSDSLFLGFIQNLVNEVGINNDTHNR